MISCNQTTGSCGTAFRLLFGSLASIGQSLLPCVAASMFCCKGVHVVHRSTMHNSQLQAQPQSHVCNSQQ